MPFAFSVLGSTTFGQEFFKPVVTPVTTQPLIVPIDNNYGSPTLTRWEYVYPPVFAQVGTPTYFIMSGSEPISTTASLMMIFTAPNGTVSSTHQVEVGKDDLAQSTGRYIGGTFAIGFVPAGFIDQPGVWKIELVVDLIKLSAVEFFTVRGTLPPPVFSGLWANATPPTAGTSVVSVAANNSLSKLVVCALNALLLSDNSGQTWYAAPGWNASINPFKCASSSDGNTIAVIDLTTNNVYLTTNRGVTFTTINVPTAFHFLTLTISGDGSKIAVGERQNVTNNFVWVSISRGAFASKPAFGHAASPFRWAALKYSRDGSTLYAHSLSGSNTFMVSTNDGATASSVYPTGHSVFQGFIDFAVSANGSTVIGSGGGPLARTTNYGATWTDIAPTPDGVTFGNGGMACSDDGLTVYYTSFNPNPMFRSADGGLTWTAQAPLPPSNTNWFSVNSVCCSADGLKAAAIDSTVVLWVTPPP